jgi:hypothetical protein
MMVLKIYCTFGGNMERVGSCDFLFVAARECIGLPKIFAAVILLNRSAFQVSQIERSELNQCITTGQHQLQLQLDGKKL